MLSRGNIHRKMSASGVNPCYRKQKFSKMLDKLIPTAQFQGKTQINSIIELIRHLYV